MPANSQRMGKVRNNEVWLCGRVFTSATTMGGDPNKTERSYDRFGLDTNIQDTNTVDGNFTLKGVTAEAGIEVQRCGVGYDPDVEVAISVGNDDSKAMPLWTNLREPKRDQYWLARFYGGWKPGLIPTEGGGANDVSLPEFVGRTDAPLIFTNCGITAQKVAAASGSGGYTGTITAGFQPGNYPFSALAVIGISGTGNGPLDWTWFDRGGALVSNTTVTVGPEDYREVPDSWAGMTSLYVVKLFTGTGTWKNRTLPAIANALWD